MILHGVGSGMTPFGQSGEVMDEIASIERVESTERRELPKMNHDADSTHGTSNPASDGNLISENTVIYNTQCHSMRDDPLMGEVDQQIREHQQDGRKTH